MSRVEGREACLGRWSAGPFAASVVGEPAFDFVILGRSKERSDAAQTLGSMPYPASAATVRNSGPLRSSANVTAWILGSSPRMTTAKVGRTAPPSALPGISPTSWEISSFAARALLQPLPLPLTYQAPFPSA
ncbi:hypothetical protein FJ987_29700 [Mesorhizobium sp. CU2]|nr:hypothetical protein FJ988_27590 [Mesorhizobium sp. CU3]TPO01767.1 hypothetical protein FJ987_29700 [Mesorhizobium sp. CU2]